MAADLVEVTVRRGSGYADRLRAYKIKVDRVGQGSLRPNETLTLFVTPGSHVLSAAIDWCSSNQLSFHATPGKALRFECGNSLVGWRLALVLVYVLFRRNQYLWIRATP